MTLEGLQIQFAFRIPHSEGHSLLASDFSLSFANSIPHSAFRIPHLESHPL